MEIIKTITENGFINELVDYLKSKLGYDEFKKIWCYERNDGSGRDFYELIPLDFITDEERDSLKDSLSDALDEDWLDVEEYDWNEDIEEIKEELEEAIYDDYDDLLYLLIEKIKKGE